MVARPAQPSHAAYGRGRMWRRAAHTARAAPIPSSQIRVVVAK